MRQIGYELTEKDKKELMKARRMAEEVDNLRGGVKELELLSVAVGSPNMDGMPKAPGNGDRVASVVMRLDAQRRTLAHMERKLDTARKKAHRICGRLDGAMRIFCVAYYADGDPFEVATAASGVKERQCYRYKEIVSGE